jgi:hypothetical protein
MRRFRIVVLGSTMKSCGLAYFAFEMHPFAVLESSFDNFHSSQCFMLLQATVDLLWHRYGQRVYCMSVWLY